MIRSFSKFARHIFIARWGCPQIKEIQRWGILTVHLVWNEPQSGYLEWIWTQVKNLGNAVKQCVHVQLYIIISSNMFRMFFDMRIKSKSGTTYRIYVWKIQKYIYVCILYNVFFLMFLDPENSYEERISIFSGYHRVEIIKKL